MSLFGCKVCASKDELIAYLKADIAKREIAWQNEREEYKRSMDRLLVKDGISPIGQGVPLPQTNATNVFDMLKLFEEEDNGGK